MSHAAKFFLCGLGLTCCAPCFAGNAFVTDYADGNVVGIASADGTVSKWFWFNEDHRGFGDVSINPFGGNVEYKINAINYNLFLGDDVKLPFQLYYGDIASNTKPADTNEQQLLDPTQGIAMQFPIARRFETSKGLCHFSTLKGYCVLGGDLTVRGVNVIEDEGQAGSGDQTKKSMIFGASASLRASLLFPIFENSHVPGTDDQDGHLGLSFGMRYYHHNTKHQDLLFGPVTTPDGDAVEFKKSFSAFTAESEFDIYKYFKLRLEYFHPFQNRDVLDDVFKASLVVTPKT